MTSTRSALLGSEEFAHVGRGIRLCFERIGDRDATPLLLVAGLGQQMRAWPTGLCEEIASRGFTVIRLDNRDAGRSTHLEFRPPSPLAMATGRLSPRRYHLGDMARDTVGLLDALGYRDAHLVGMSMGAMIAQTVAAHFPARARSLTSMMSMTGARRVGRPALSTWRMLLGRPPKTRAEAIDNAVRMYRHIGSRGFAFDETWIRATAGEAWDRDSSSSGFRRQFAAILTSGDRTHELAGITAPTLVVHGDRDLMVNPTGGAATARAITGARLETVRGMGHDLPTAAWPTLVDLIVDHTRRAAMRA